MRKRDSVGKLISTLAVGQSRLSSRMRHWRIFCWLFVILPSTISNGGMERLLSFQVLLQNFHHFIEHFFIEVEHHLLWS
jgi:hypothetical protein